jgi:hypothetical protein
MGVLPPPSNMFACRTEYKLQGINGVLGMISSNIKQGSLCTEGIKGFRTLRFCRGWRRWHKEELQWTGAGGSRWEGTVRGGASSLAMLWGVRWCRVGRARVPGTGVTWCPCPCQPHLLGTAGGPAPDPVASATRSHKERERERHKEEKEKAAAAGGKSGLGLVLVEEVELYGPLGHYVAHDEKFLATSRTTLVGTFTDRPFNAISEIFCWPTIQC